MRLSVRDELPDEIDSADVAESLYNQLFHTELVWPVIFYGGYAAFEPDVSYPKDIPRLLPFHLNHANLGALL